MERIVCDMVLERMQEQWIKEQDVFFKRMQNAVQNGVARAFKA